jgi:hypothetical protein
LAHLQDTFDFGQPAPGRLVAFLRLARRPARRDRSLQDEI